MLPDEQLSPEQVEVLRKMTPAQRWATANNLYWTMRRYKGAYLRRLHPDWSESKIEITVRDLFANARA